MADKDENSAKMMEEELYDNGGDGKNQRQKPIISGDQLDVEAYASLYSGRTKIRRLLHIADRCDNRTMQLEALRMAYDEAKKGEDTNLFREVAVRIDGRLGPDYSMDSAWVESIERRLVQRTEKFQNELNVYKVMLLYMSNLQS